MKSKPVSEVEIGAAATRYFDERGFATYKEVEAFGYRADLVMVQERLVFAAECKVSLSLELLAQAEQWTKYAHRVWAVVPRPKRGGRRAIHLVRVLLSAIGVGLLEVDVRTGQVYETIPAPLNRRARVDLLRGRLHEQQRTWADAGSKSGGQFTPFKATCLAVAEFVAANPGCGMKAVLEGIKHHYRTDSTAGQCILFWITSGRIRGVRGEWKRGAWRFLPVAVEPGTPIILSRQQARATKAVQPVTVR